MTLKEAETTKTVRQPIDEHDQHASRHGKAPKLERFFEAMVKADASDLHFKAGTPPHMRRNAILVKTSEPELDGDEILEMAYEIMTDKQRAYFEQHGTIDLAHELEGSDRFRLNIFRQRGDVSIAVRRVTRRIPEFEELHLPPVVGKIAERQQGLVLLAGPSGCGKSTTIASMLEHINRTRPCHIVTIEDPIEYIYEDKKALVSQRAVGIDVESFDTAMKYLMREDPDVVLSGGRRDHETFQAALRASETGHLVFGTVHASSAGQTITRILDLFPKDSRDFIRQSLAYNLQAIICQKLLPSVADDIERIPAVEILITNPSVRQLIEEERESELIDVIRSHERDGMLSFAKSLLELVQKDYVDPKVAYSIAPNPDELRMMLKGISSSHSGFLGH